MKPAEFKDYVAILANNAADRHQHNLVFTNELAASFAKYGIGTIPIDYIAHPRQVTEAAQDPHCIFFVCYNGFGSELLLNAGPGDLRSLFTCYKKQLFDLMHDCPAHESMSHQVASTGDYRTLLITDYGYANVAKMLGIRRVYFSPSITFPHASPDYIEPVHSREIDILLPMGLASPELVLDRYGKPRNHRQRLFREIFHAVTEKAVDRLDCDPLLEIFRALSDMRVATTVDDPDTLFLITTTLDFVKFSRRHNLIHAIRHLPVTVISDRKIDLPTGDGRLQFIEERTFPRLIETMAHSKSVICPLPHYSGFHERALAAFTTGAAVIAAPNEILETNFAINEEMFLYRSLEDLTYFLENSLAGQHDLHSVAENGRRKAIDYYHPSRLTKLMLSLHASIQ
ncbi:glycosyltransferase family 1 protein [Cupriavidus alkaliphilus]|uniref:Spore protein YkvP/CgeB glycosyl transferase-like domain-containing protein n=1 Tax=Cupriavidus alkaliphilus TaxID=942866 RepID=A0A7W4V6Z1_9BURK|nr:glycosyltransferase family 1 protein [Cupriavidus alkaliphilus]MBB3006212.1 hypothetical protein [Cupriavidus alkaliphilus]SCB16511.1 hypothetical protein GA0116996_103438 [Cupriavidus alkaliphilus]